MLPQIIALYRKLPGQPFKPLLKRAYQSYVGLFGNRRVVARIQGIRFDLDLREVIDRAIYFQGSFEPLTSSVLLERAQPGMTVLDIGANMGWHTCRLAKRVQPGRVIAFEPMSWARGRLLRNVELNDLRNVRVESIGLSDRNEKITIHFRSSWKVEATRSSSTEDPASRNPEEVEFMTLDSYAASTGLSDVNLIKIDVDGYELKVLRGAAQLLARCKPVIILELCSYTLAWYGDGLPELLDLLSELGYELYDERGMVRYPDRESVMASVPADSTINVVCTIPAGSAPRSPTGGQP